MFCHQYEVLVVLQGISYFVVHTNTFSNRTEKRNIIGQLRFCTPDTNNIPEMVTVTNHLELALGETLYKTTGGGVGGTFCNEMRVRCQKKNRF